MAVYLYSKKCVIRYPNLKHVLRKMFIFNGIQLRSTRNVYSSAFFSLDPPDLDFNYICNPENINLIASNIKRRKLVASIEKVQNLYKNVHQLQSDIRAMDQKDGTLVEHLKLQKYELQNEAKKIPNQAHPDVTNNASDDPVVVKIVGNKPEFPFEPLEFYKLANALGVFQKADQIAKMVGKRGYYLKGDLADLEQALINFTMDRLIQKGFCPVSVPDLLHSAVIEGCGMETKGERSQVFHLGTSWGNEICLSGTAEMALSSYFIGKKIKERDLPCRLAAVSRCYRAEFPTNKEDKGIYRVPQFTKVEMFGITANRTGEESNKLMEEFVSLQQSLFSELNLHFKVLDMPLCDMGPSAYRKYDIEAWMPGKGIYGEISSASNCTDYQSRRLHIKYQPGAPDGSTGLKKKFVHTVNGTACAIPRMLITIFECFQNAQGEITVPKALVPYMDGKDVITTRSNQETVHWIERRLADIISNIK